MSLRSLPASSWTVRAWCACGAVLGLVLVAGCTSTPDFFPTCVNPYDTSSCPADDAGADTSSPTTGDATAADDAAVDDAAPADDGETPDGTAAPTDGAVGDAGADAAPSADD